jgi:hypothetical protein
MIEAEGEGTLPLYPSRSLSQVNRTKRQLGITWYITKDGRHLIHTDTSTCVNGAFRGFHILPLSKDLLVLSLYSDKSTDPVESLRAGSVNGCIA